MLRTVKRGFAEAACAAGVHHLSRRSHGHDLLILTYHGIVATRPRRAWTPLLVTQHDFERQMRYLARHYRILPIDAALAELWDGGLRTPTACITFDDGYRNNYTAALPVLTALGIPATVYLATALIGTDRRVWTTATALPRTAIERLKRLPPRERVAALGELSTQDDGEFQMLDWSEVRAMEASGLVSFGGHTANHEILSNLDADERRAEIDGCLETLRSHLAAPSRTFAYPNGQPEDFDAAVVAALRRAGIVAAVSTIEGFAERGGDRFALRRVAVGGDLSYSQFRLLTAGVVTRLRVAARSLAYQTAY